MTPCFPDISLSTERLVLRPFGETDIPALADMMNDEMVTTWSSVPHPYTGSDAEQWVRGSAPEERTSGRGIVFAVHELLTQRLVGVMHLQHTDWRVRATEAGYVVAPWARGEGYAAEALHAVARWLFTDQGFERLELRTAAGNTASQQVAQKVGCISEGVLRGAGLMRTRSDDWTTGQGPAEAEWSEIRTDLIVWGLLPEDLDDAGEEPLTIVERTPADSRRPLR
ncbi:GNAT family N-acetyltransferase [Streptomyces sp. JJ66]|uniref:GNAT family N-acetyltransferase n=1 Tax=Streptomyces sp. JJ66 TaxID=2803843 RepID=UPI001C578352|nr:GNAT family N-acetyltransferase [Streptomyces sp. JJ66]MBW1604100.1 GNAT family N-acetyltransferase [Streptomyces sp. JJ66]